MKTRAINPEQAQRRATNTPFGQMLQQHRQDVDLGQTALASLVGCHQSHIALLEVGRRTPTRRFVLALTGAFGLNTSQTDRLLYAAGYAPQVDYQTLWEREHGSFEDQTKWCSGCQQFLPSGPNGVFSVDRSRRDGLVPYCRSCKAAKWTAHIKKMVRESA